MENIINSVMEALRRSGFVEVEVSARHVHLTQEHVEILFGKGSTLTPKRPLSQPGQFLCEERVTLVGPKAKKERVAVLGPVRKSTQAELSRSDCIEIGVNAPLRQSGDVSGSAPVKIEGPCGTIDIEQGVIVAQNHIHTTPEIAKKLNLQDKQKVSVQVITQRPITFDDVLVRVDDSFNFRMHVDFDEANAAMINGFTLGKITL